MNVFDVEEEEKLTAMAMQAGNAETFEAELDANLIDPLALLLAQATGMGTTAPPTNIAPSLFASDLDFVTMGLDRLSETDKVKSKVRAKEKLVELHWTPDLKRRFQRLPVEIRPKDGVVLLTADPDRMQRALVEARKEENAWPQHQLLWANSPVLHWLADRMRAGFGRHSAPVLLVPQLDGLEHFVLVISGLLPNRRGQSLVHRWYAVHFKGSRFDRVEPFEEFLAATGLGRQSLPNASEELDTEALESLLPKAVDAVRRRLEADRDAFRAELGPKLNNELERLERLEARQLGHIESLFEQRRDARAEQEKAQQERQVKKLFGEYQQWIKDAMTTADEPFLQVIASLVGGAA
jgi:hypothetical protein